MRPDIVVVCGRAAIVVSGDRARELVEAAGASSDRLRAAMQPLNPLPLGDIHPHHVKKTTQGATGIRLHELQPRPSPRFERFPHIRPWPLRRYEPKQPVVYARADWCSVSRHDNAPPYCARCCKSQANRATGLWRLATTPVPVRQLRRHQPNDHAEARGLPLLFHEPGRST